MGVIFVEFKNQVEVEGQKIIVGRREKVNFFALGLKNIDAKIDTGAYTSSIHCASIQEIDNKLYCKFIDTSEGVRQIRELVFDSYNIAVVKSSNGITELRYQIITTVQFGEKEYAIELTLTDRAEMKYPVLIGRKFLKKKFIVDVSLINQLKLMQKNETKDEDGHSV